MATIRVRPTAGNVAGTPRRVSTAPKLGQAPTVSPEQAAAALSRARPLALSSLLSGLTALTLVVIGDPYWLSVPCAGIAMLVGLLVNRRISDAHPASHVGVMLGVVALFLWLIVDVVLGLILGFEFSLFMAHP